MNIPGMLYRMLFYRSHEHPRNVRGFCFPEAMDIPGMLYRMLFYRSHEHPKNVI
jgi:hypothetical protein